MGRLLVLHGALTCCRAGVACAQPYVQLTRVTSIPTRALRGLASEGRRCTNAVAEPIDRPISITVEVRGVCCPEQRYTGCSWLCIARRWPMTSTWT